MKKLLVTGVLASTALFLLGGCGSSSAKSNAASSSEKTSDGKKTIDFWSFWGSGARKEVIEEIIDDYNQSQDKIQVNYKYQPWGDIWTKSLHLGGTLLLLLFLFFLGPIYVVLVGGSSLLYLQTFLFFGRKEIKSPSKV